MKLDGIKMHLNIDLDRGANMYYLKRAENRKSEMKQQKTGIEYLTFPMLYDIKNIKHLFTTRIGGASESMFTSMNLCLTSGDQEEAVIVHYKRIAKDF